MNTILLRSAKIDSAPFEFYVVVSVHSMDAILDMFYAGQIVTCKALCFPSLLSLRAESFVGRFMLTRRPAFFWSPLSSCKPDAAFTRRTIVAELFGFCAFAHEEYAIYENESQCLYESQTPNMCSAWV